MALGVKTYSKGLFEIGDLAFAKTSVNGQSYIYNSQPTDDSSSFELVSDGSPLLFGQVLNDEVEDITNGYFVWLEIKTAEGKIGYILRDYALYRTEANPAYNYPEKTTKQPFDWTGLFSTISGVASSVVGLFSSKNNSNTEAQTTTSTQNGTIQATPTTEGSFFQKNGLMILIAALVATLLFLIFKKPKTKQVIYQGNNPNSFNQNNPNNLNQSY